MATVAADRLIDQLKNLVLLASPGGKPAKVLFIVADDMREKDGGRGAMIAYATDTLGISEKDIRWVASWEEATSIISKFSHIDRLVMVIHGEGGQILIGDGSYYVDELDVPAPWPTIDEVVMEGCALARNATRTLAFTKRMKAKKLVAWNMWHGVSNDQVKPGTKIADIQERRSLFQSYLLPGTPNAATIQAQADAKKGQKAERVRFIGREWLRDDFVDDEDVPLPPNSRHKFHTRFKAVSNARTITTEAQAAEFTEEEEAPAGREPRQVIFQPAP